MFGKVKYLLVIGLLLLIPACATGQATGSFIDIDATVEARLAIIPTPTPQIITQEFIVEKEVPIETEVIKELIVEKEVPVEVEKIVEEADCSPRQLKNNLTNGGIYCFNWKELRKELENLSNSITSLL